MRKILTMVTIAITTALQAQNTLTSDIIEGGKTLVELIKIIRTPAMATATSFQPVVNYVDSCGAKKLADISFKNKTEKNMEVSLFYRTGNTYDKNPLSLTLSAFSQEYFYELKAGIYKYKIVCRDEKAAYAMHEGELRLQPCDKLIKEIK